MGQFLHAILRLVLLRGSPAALPSSQRALTLVVALFVVSTPLFLEVLGDGSLSIGAYLAATAVIYGGYAVLLVVNARRTRLNQTLLAVLGTDLVLASAQLVLVLVSQPFGAHPVWVTLFIYCWLVVVHSRILGAALDWNPVVAFAFVFSMSLLGNSLLAAMASSPDETAALVLPVRAA